MITSTIFLVLIGALPYKPTVSAYIDYEPIKITVNENFNGPGQVAQGLPTLDPGYVHQGANFYFKPQLNLRPSYIPSHIKALISTICQNTKSCKKEPSELVFNNDKLTEILTRLDQPITDFTKEKLSGIVPEKKIITEIVQPLENCLPELVVIPEETKMKDVLIEEVKITERSPTPVEVIIEDNSSEFVVEKGKIPEILKPLDEPLPDFTKETLPEIVVGREKKTDIINPLENLPELVVIPEETTMKDILMEEVKMTEVSTPTPVEVIIDQKLELPPPPPSLLTPIIINEELKPIISEHIVIPEAPVLPPLPLNVIPPVAVEEVKIEEPILLENSIEVLSPIPEPIPNPEITLENTSPIVVEEVRKIEEPTLLKGSIGVFPLLPEISTGAILGPLPVPEVNNLIKEVKITEVSTPTPVEVIIEQKLELPAPPSSLLTPIIINEETTMKDCLVAEVKITEVSTPTPVEVIIEHKLELPSPPPSLLTPIIINEETTMKDFLEEEVKITEVSTPTPVEVIIEQKLELPPSPPSLLTPITINEETTMKNNLIKEVKITEVSTPTPVEVTIEQKLELPAPPSSLLTPIIINAETTMKDCLVEEVKITEVSTPTPVEVIIEQKIELPPSPPSLLTPITINEETTMKNNLIKEVKITEVSTPTPVEVTIEQKLELPAPPSSLLTPIIINEETTMKDCLVEEVKITEVSTPTPVEVIIEQKLELPPSPPSLLTPIIINEELKPIISEHIVIPEAPVLPPLPLNVIPPVAVEEVKIEEPILLENSIEVLSPIPEPIPNPEITLENISPIVVEEVRKIEEPTLLEGSIGVFPPLPEISTGTILGPLPVPEVNNLIKEVKITEVSTPTPVEVTIEQKLELPRPPSSLLTPIIINEETTMKDCLVEEVKITEVSTPTPVEVIIEHKLELPSPPPSLLTPIIINEETTMKDILVEEVKITEVSTPTPVEVIIELKLELPPSPPSLLTPIIINEETTMKNNLIKEVKITEMSTPTPVEVTIEQKLELPPPPSSLLTPIIINEETTMKDCLVEEVKITEVPTPTPVEVIIEQKLELPPSPPSLLTPIIINEETTMKNNLIKEVKITEVSTPTPVEVTIEQKLELPAPPSSLLTPIIINEETTMKDCLVEEVEITEVSTPTPVEVIIEHKLELPPPPPSLLTPIIINEEPKPIISELIVIPEAPILPPLPLNVIPPVAVEEVKIEEPILLENSIEVLSPIPEPIPIPEITLENISPIVVEEVRKIEEPTLLEGSIGVFPPLPEISTGAILGPLPVPEVTDTFGLENTPPVVVEEEVKIDEPILLEGSIGVFPRIAEISTGTLLEPIIVPEITDTFGLENIPSVVVEEEVKIDEPILLDGSIGVVPPIPEISTGTIPEPIIVPEITDTFGLKNIPPVFVEEVKIDEPILLEESVGVFPPEVPEISTGPIPKPIVPEVRNFFLLENIRPVILEEVKVEEFVEVFPKVAEITTGPKLESIKIPEITNSYVLEEVPQQKPCTQCVITVKENITPEIIPQPPKRMEVFTYVPIASHLSTRFPKIKAKEIVIPELTSLQAKIHKNHPFRLPIIPFPKHPFNKIMTPKFDKKKDSLYPISFANNIVEKHIVPHMKFKQKHGKINTHPFQLSEKFHLNKMH